MSLTVLAVLISSKKKRVRLTLEFYSFEYSSHLMETALNAAIVNSQRVLEFLKLFIPGMLQEFNVGMYVRQHYVSHLQFLSPTYKRSEVFDPPLIFV